MICLKHGPVHTRPFEPGIYRPKCLTCGRWVARVGTKWVAA